MHYAKVLRYTTSKPVCVWHSFRLIYQMMNALWLCDNISITMPLDGRGEDAGDQPAGAVCGGAV